MGGSVAKVQTEIDISEGNVDTGGVGDFHLLAGKGMQPISHRTVLFGIFRLAELRFTIESGWSPMYKLSPRRCCALARAFYLQMSRRTPIEADNPRMDPSTTAFRNSSPSSRSPTWTSANFVQLAEHASAAA